jgi:hypothetical protein
LAAAVGGGLFDEVWEVAGRVRENPCIGNRTTGRRDNVEGFCGTAEAAGAIWILAEGT